MLFYVARQIMRDALAATSCVGVRVTLNLFLENGYTYTLDYINSTVGFFAVSYQSGQILRRRCPSQAKFFGHQGCTLSASLMLRHKSRIRCSFFDLEGEGMC